MACSALKQNPDIFWNVCFSDEVHFIAMALSINIMEFIGHQSSQILTGIEKCSIIELFMFGLGYVISPNDQIIGPHFFERTINDLLYLEFF